MMVNEEGLLKGLPVNLVGCYPYKTHEHGSPIVGDICLMNESQRGVVTPLTQSGIDNFSYLLDVANKLKEAT